MDRKNRHRPAVCPDCESPLPTTLLCAMCGQCDGRAYEKARDLSRANPAPARTGGSREARTYIALCDKCEGPLKTNGVCTQCAP